MDQSNYEACYSLNRFLKATFDPQTRKNSIFLSYILLLCSRFLHQSTEQFLVKYQIGQLIDMKSLIRQTKYINMKLEQNRPFQSKMMQQINQGIFRPKNNEINLAFYLIGNLPLKKMIITDLSNIQILILEGNAITCEGIGYLKDGCWNSLHTLNLKCNSIGQLGIQKLVQTNWPSLNILNLSKNQITNQCLKSLNQTNLSNLTELYLSQNKLFGIGIGYLVSCNLPNLKIMDLNYNNIQISGIRKLIQAQWPKLQILFLQWNKINDECLQYLAEGDWKYLQKLDLCSNLIMNQGIRHLFRANWPHLTILDIKSRLIQPQNHINIKSDLQAYFSNLKEIRI